MNSTYISWLISLTLMGTTATLANNTPTGTFDMGIGTFFSNLFQNESLSDSVPSSYYPSANTNAPRTLQTHEEFPVEMFKRKGFTNILDLSGWTEQEKESVRRYAPWHTVYLYVSDVDNRVVYKIHPWTLHFDQWEGVEMQTTYTPEELEADLQYLSNWKNRNTVDVDWNAVLQK